MNQHAHKNHHGTNQRTQRRSYRVHCRQTWRKTGWINIAETEDDEILPVVVNLGRRGERATFVYQSSARRVNNESPRTHAEAVMQQCPDVERSLVTVTRQLAKCDVRRDAEGFRVLLEKKMEEAVDWQEAKGSKACYRKVDYE
jgi:hypothetical protein